MQKNFDRALQFVLIHEGGYSDHPDDPGGATMKGITLDAFRRHFGEDKTTEDLRNITQDQLRKIYKIDYWDKCRADELPSGVDYATFDAAVNSGSWRASSWLQAAVGAGRDGVIGPKTLGKIAAHEPIVIIQRQCDYRLEFLRGLSTFAIFGRGWMRRIKDVRQQAIEMSE